MRDSGTTPHPPVSGTARKRRRRLGPMQSRGDILREMRKLPGDVVAGRISLATYGRRLYLLNLLLGTQSVGTSDTIHQRRPGPGYSNTASPLD